jgi:hypothetical protein
MKTRIRINPEETLPVETKKMVIGRRYYPWYYGKKSTYRSYRSYFVGALRPGTSDYVVGTCNPSVPDGWVTGECGAYAARTYRALCALPGFKEE